MNLIKYLKFFLLIPALIFATASIAQHDTCNDIASKDLKKLRKAEEDVKGETFAKALTTLDALHKKYPECLDIQNLQAKIHYRLENYVTAIEIFQSIYDENPLYEGTLAYALGKLYYDNGIYEKAIQPLKDFIQRNPGSYYREFAEEFLMLSHERLRILSDTLLNFKPERLSDSINTPLPEYFPALSVDNQFLLFTRRVNGQEDIYISEKNSQGEWCDAVPMNEINTPFGNEGGHTISADGRVFVFTACRHRGTYGGCDLFISYSLGDGNWSAPLNMGPKINTKGWEAQPSLSPDKRQLYFASTRDGGKSKIYVASLQEDGSYGNVQRIGKPIDSEGNDWAPFIAFDNETLYFSSDGHPGLGSRDLFLSRRDSLGNWGEPFNLGSPLNTEKEEGTIFVNSTATRAYISSDLAGSLDIYEFELDASIAPRPVTYIKGYVYDSLSRDKLEANVTVLRLRDSTSVAEIKTSADGYFLSVLPIGEEYAFWVDKDAYLFHSSHHSLKDSRGIYNPQEIDIPLLAIYDINENTSIILQNILFETGSSQLLPAAFPELNKLLSFMQTETSAGIHIIGHTDDVGTAADNQVLSEDRARVVMNYLIDKGIDRNRLSSEGMGEAIPLVPNNSDENRALNRRTEIQFKFP